LAESCSRHQREALDTLDLLRLNPDTACFWGTLNCGELAMAMSMIISSLMTQLAVEVK
jgi:hypothetical protein